MLPIVTSVALRQIDRQKIFGPRVDAARMELAATDVRNWNGDVNIRLLTSPATESADQAKYAREEPGRSARLHHQGRLGDSRAAGASQFGHPQPKPRRSARASGRQHIGTLSRED